MIKELKKQKLMKNQKGFTLIEILVVITILGILTASIFLAVRPVERFRAAQETRAQTALEAIAKAVQMYNADSDGLYPAEVQGIPAEINTYISDKAQLDEGPWNGSYYDYDNYQGMDCVDNEAETTIQVAIRNVPYHNPDGSSNWTIYYVIEGKGAANCIGANTTDGECVNCSGGN